VVYDPLLDELYCATRGQGATLNGRPIRVSREDALGRSLIATGFAYDVHRSHADNLDNFATVLKRARAIRRDGSAALNLCYVAAGRWHPAGAMLDAPDVNLVSPEALLRQILYGNRFFERELGKRSADLFLPDCFGFGWALPSIAAHCGLAGLSGQKFRKWGGETPFAIGLWRGPDGRGVVAALRPEGYGEGLDEDLSRAERWLGWRY